MSNRETPSPVASTEREGLAVQALRRIAAGPELPLDGTVRTPKEIAIFVAQWSQDQAKRALEKAPLTPTPIEVMLEKKLTRIRDDFTCIFGDSIDDSPDDKELDNWNHCQHCLAELALMDADHMRHHLGVTDTVEAENVEKPR